MIMGKFTTSVLVFNLLLHCLESFGQTRHLLDPVYWNTSNPLFRSTSKRRHYRLNGEIDDKLDIICPKRDHVGDGEHLLYFKLFLVDEEGYQDCNTSKGHRLITCDLPDREKKYTFIFQEISPSPFGLQFVAGKSYYIISTSDGSKSGLEESKGGVCTIYNMKIELKIHPKGGSNEVTDVQPIPPPKITNTNVNFDISNQPKETIPKKQINQQTANVVKEDPPSAGNIPTDQLAGNGLIIGIVLGACAVIFILLLALIGHKLRKRRRRHKKYHSAPTSTRDPGNMQEVTLLRIAPPTRQTHHSDYRSVGTEYRSVASISSHSEVRPPPSYNESFLDNGGSVVAV